MGFSRSKSEYHLLVEDIENMDDTYRKYVTKGEEFSDSSE